MIYLFQLKQFTRILIRLLQPSIYLTELLFGTFLPKEFDYQFVIQLTHNFFRHTIKTIVTIKTLIPYSKNIYTLPNKKIKITRIK